MERDQFITCVICDTIAKEAVESSCCRSTYCCKCAQNIKDKTCPNCEEKSFTFKESFIARLVIGKMPYECVYCKEKLILGDADSHSSKCPQTPRKCNISGCSFEAPTKEFLLHLVSQHKGEVINHFGKNAEGQSQNQVDKAQQLLNPLVKRNNSAGNAAVLGTSGKFYCGKALPEKCSCCNGYCGPSNGCNCRPCMQLDIEYRNLPCGYWVNSGGWVCRKGENGNVYCGRKKSGRANDYCGPEEGPPCYSCIILQEQLEGRYKGIN